MSVTDENARGIVAIAASTGGPYVLARIFEQLPGDYPVPIVVAQHISDGFAEGMADWLNDKTALEIVTPAHGVPLRPGRVYVAPPEFNMRVGARKVAELFERQPHEIHHPSCDILLCSAAEVYGRSCIGVILTGMGSDGVAGIRKIREAGGTTIAQDEASSLIFGMPRLAIESGCIDSALSPEGIAAELVRLRHRAAGRVVAVGARQ